MHSAIIIFSYLIWTTEILIKCSAVWVLIDIHRYVETGIINWNKENYRVTATKNIIVWIFFLWRQFSNTRWKTFIGATKLHFLSYLFIQKLTWKKNEEIKREIEIWWQMWIFFVFYVFLLKYWSVVELNQGAQVIILDSFLLIGNLQIRFLSIFVKKSNWEWTFAW